MRKYNTIDNDCDRFKKTNLFCIGSLVPMECMLSEDLLFCSDGTLTGVVAAERARLGEETAPKIS